MANPSSSTKPSEVSTVVSLHPLVLLTASDLIIRHRLRQLDGPVVGLLLGRQNGIEVTAEHAFTAKMSNGLLDQDQDWTTRRIEQYKDVHKNPALEVVGWFTLCPDDGPLPEHAAIQKQLVSLYVENPILLALHPTAFHSADSVGGKLPISIFEAIPDDQTAEDGKMQIDGVEATNMKFKIVPYTIETDEAEMIAINYVAKGAGSAAAVTQTNQSSGSVTKEQSDNKPKEKPLSQASKTSSEKLSSLTSDEEDQIASVTTRLNSVRMLQSRLQVMMKLLQSMPPSYISDQSVALTENCPSPAHLPHLRNMQALLSRLSLLTPSNQQSAEALQQASQSQANDVALSSVLAQLGKDIQDLSELGRKFATVEQGRSAKAKNKGSFGQNPYSGIVDELEGRVAGAAATVM